MPKVNLITISKDLEDIMLKDYPGIIKEDMKDKKVIDETTHYFFTNLDKDTLLKFLTENEEFKELVGLEEYIITEEPRTFMHSSVKRKANYSEVPEKIRVFLPNYYV
ncbi:hypothetical protein KY321_00305 [Candidatus Woesearchaeota archaeon]|nr:hypothetical protein [Candidatus Woesearchaeota archaeon]